MLSGIRVSTSGARWRCKPGRLSNSPIRGIAPRLLSGGGIEAYILSQPLPLSGLLMVSRAPSSWVNDLSPIAAADWSYERAGHLIDRAGFGAPPEEIAKLAAM